MDLATRLTVATVTLVLVATAVVAVVTYLPLRESVLASRLTWLQSDARQGIVGLGNLIDAAEADVRLLAEIPDSVVALNNADAADTALARTHLNRIFSAMLTAKSDYSQIRLLRDDGSGQEVLRLDRNGPGGSIRSVPVDELQPKGSRGYFREAMALQPSELYVSAIELNREHGEVDVPHQPVLRVASPLRGAGNGNAGLVIINIDLRRAFARLRAVGGPDTDVYLVNEVGDFLIHPDSSRAFGFELGRPFRLKDQFSDLPAPRDIGSGDIQFEESSSRDGDLTMAAAFGRLGSQRTGAVILASPQSAVLGPAGSTLQLVAAASVATVVLAVLLAGVLARSVARPLAKLAHTIDQFDRGEQIQLPERAPGELRLLSNAIHRHIERERLYNAAVESSVDAIVTTDRDGNITAWNRAAEELYGYSREEALGRSKRMLVPDDCLDEFDDILSAVRQGKPTTHIDTKRKSKTGRELPVALSVSPIRSAQGEVLGIFSIARDLTPEREADMLFRQAVDASPAAMIMMDRNGHIVLTNHEVMELFGYSGDDLYGEPVEVLLPEQFRDTHPALRQEFMTEPTKRMMGIGRELYGRRKNGSMFAVEVGLNPLTTAQGPMVLAVVVDITERRRTEQALAERSAELERSNAELEQFAYVASHDLQEPLRMVYSFCELLKEQYGDKFDKDGQEFIEFAVDGARRMRQMIDDLLDYSRVQTSEMQLEPISAQRALDSALFYLSSAIKDCDAEVRHDALPSVLGNETQIARVFQNIIGNALKFRGPTQPIIEITCHAEGANQVFAIADNGIGFRQNENERIFGVFQRLHRREEYPGTGIGLAVCKRIVDRHGGDIWAEAGAGEGTVFKFTLPSAGGIAELPGMGEVASDGDGIEDEGTA